ncbi:uncharacterized protein LOC122522719 [Polistes fuscatus]|uniref:uncharacterized protein LOC122522719 n=2 Tax=Polistes fuscatus TaxID=30207 RepID=UPI001CA9A70B|nr:uncharacterized protein LOC122522719 [Polistes fuscatus]
MCRVRRGDGTYKQCRALLDTCAAAHFITEDVAKELRLPIRPYSIPINAINDTRTRSTGIIEITIQSLDSRYKRNLSLLIVPKIADQVPSEVFPRELIKIPIDRKLADPQFHLPRPVDILIGSGATLSLMSVGQFRLSRARGDLILQKTQLGWVVVGGIDSEESKEKTALFATTELRDQLERFWLIEDAIVTRTEGTQEVECETHYTQNTKRDETGRYIVRLPFREKGHDYSELYHIALRRFHNLWKKLNANPELRKEYERTMQEYLTLGHMSLVEDDPTGGCYLPHHAVIKSTSTTTKVRVVFDASAKNSQGISLNSTLLVGPTIQDTLVEHLLRFRTYRYVLTADIEKMYRQIWIHPDDRQYQRIFWIHKDRIRTFELNTVTFGIASAPFLAIRTIKQLAKDESVNYPLGAEILNRDLYVDDLITGTDDVETLGRIRDQTIEILKRGGFNIRQWASNYRPILDKLDTKKVNVEFFSGETSILKTLGISWNTHHDHLIYTVAPIDLHEKITKRRILSEIAKIYDPLGLLGPIILTAKILIQDCWKTKVEWDESVPNALHSSWTRFAEQLKLIDNLTIERRLIIDNHDEVQIHGFCDASQAGYGGSLYVRSRDQVGNVHVRLFCAKSRVAPLKDTTIPRLELCGALTLARLYREIRASCGIRPNKIIFWSDSTIVLGWLRRDPNTLKQFTANRVREIQEICVGITWRHVRTENNPADALSRGQLPREFIKNNSWFHGPSWLRRPELEWPIQTETETDELPELKKIPLLMTRIEPESIFRRFSNYTRLLRITARCRRWVKTNSYRGEISTAEIIDTERHVLRLIQNEQFRAEKDRLTESGGVKGARLAALNPIIDETGLIRVGGRLKNANLPFQEKCPILLPSHHHVTDLLIRKFHEQNFHAGIQTTLYAIRQRFWLLDGKNQVRKIVRHCVRCIRFRASGIQYKMGDLPRSRVQETIAFSHTGVDFFGPLYVKEKKYRNKGRVKVYGCIFVCMCIKAVHIELVSDLTTDAFLAAFRRFTGRRAIPSHVYSDNGTNFVGANNQLRELYALIESEEYKTKIHNYATDQRISWHFNPPLSPHFGGLWEAAVKSFKHHFRRVVGETLFTYEELNTFAIEIEAILNSRPLCPISSDPNDATALTPAHFLVGRPLNMLPEENYENTPINRLSSWKHITKVRQDFWRRWYIEYLRELQKRQKWNNSQYKLEKDTIVILIDKNQPCMRWQLGRIIDVHPGEDDVVRVVTIKTTHGNIKRNATTICPLLSDR